ncbi:hypothetical protein SAMN06264364_1339 [Quadrisphaera granulorum]|uniref:Uncharacterized protein n=1 Tax=Quadrisphaera granulorum TaxID=317664 RepID=A0A315ZQW8_9ACTN|nr:hypothetical protein [Quadrisphaera granulorum]PWJ47985.1 hypothetical protein BXY45_1339 [Quadrisphaera granulorum]SZE98557.1 hypothetical protein SAMN06264364_1339 [Quadrisphaera granulorum]
MGKLVLVGLGVVAAAVGAVQAARSVSTSQGGWAGLSEGVRAFAADVRAGAAEREEELRIALGVDTGTLDEATARDLLENPTAPRRGLHAG